jgi:hypothetical protein
MKKIISINFPLLKCVLSSGDHSPFPLFAECVAKEKERARAEWWKRADAAAAAGPIRTLSIWTDARAQKEKINRSRLNFEKMCVLFIYYLGSAHKRLLTLCSRVCVREGKKEKGQCTNWREREKGRKSSKSYTPTATKIK